MTILTEPLRVHHAHCDDLFVAAEAAAGERDWASAMRLLPEFIAAMQCHFRTEEEALFPAYEAATGMALGPTRMMRIEHAQMRELFDRLEAAMTSRNGPDFAGVAETLLVLMQQHNMKEENILYPMCDRGLETQAEALTATLQVRLGTSCPAIP